MRTTSAVVTVAARISTVLLVGACTGNSAEKSSAADRWVIEEELRIGQFEGAPEYTFGQIGGVFPGPAGGLWVFESQASELRLYDSNGNFVRKVGRRGDGPGEFSGGYGCAFSGPDREIWVEDARRRWQRFDSTGVLLGSNPSTSNIGCGIRRATHDGRLLVVNTVLMRPGAPPERSFFIEHRLTPEGTLVSGDTFPWPLMPEAQRVTWTPPSGRPRITNVIPFTDRPHGILGSSGDFWVSYGAGRYAIQRRTLVDDSLFTIERQYTPVPIPDSIRARAIREFQPEGMTAQGGFDPDQVPHVYPPFDRFVEASDGRLWVWRQIGDGKVGLDVFSADGDYLAAVDLPPGLDRMSIGHITSDYMYGVARGELDVPYVVRLAIRRQPQ